MFSSAIGVPTDSAKNVPKATSPAQAGGTKASTNQAAAQLTSPLTINASFAADVYNSAPSSSIPSTSHLRDIQGGAEIDYIVKTSNLPKVGALIGDMTASGTYYYQDQTSPAILKGPPSTITFTGLPTPATQVYTQRG